MNQLGQFEQNLLTELREVVAERHTVAAPRPRKRLVLAAAGGGLLATGLLVGIPAMNGDQTPAAYAVTTNDDGMVTIVVNRLEDPDGLERELAANGVTADVTFAPPGKECNYKPHRYESTTDVRTITLQIARDGDTITMPSVDLKDLEDRTLVVEGRRLPAPDPDGIAPFAIAYGIAEGPVAPCELIDLPPN